MKAIGWATFFLWYFMSIGKYSAFFLGERQFCRSMQLKSNLQRVILTVPKQSFADQYQEILYELIPESSIVRWFVSSISENNAMLEAVIEPNGIGNSGTTIVKRNFAEDSKYH